MAKSAEESLTELVTRVAKQGMEWLSSVGPDEWQQEHWRALNDILKTITRDNRQLTNPQVRGDINSMSDEELERMLEGDD